MRDTLRILQVAQTDQDGGGSSRVVNNLHSAYLEMGLDAHLLVKTKVSQAPGVFPINPFSGTLFYAPILCWLDFKLQKIGQFRGKQKVRDFIQQLALPKRIRDRSQGSDDFNYPYSWHLLDDPNWHPDIIHFHNLSGNYFDLRVLPALSHQVPVCVTMHDMWLLTGHCAHPIDCPGWLNGCGNCPDLDRLPSVPRDQTHTNWLQKKEIYAASKLHITGNSQWMVGMINKSMLNPTDLKVIYPGIDLTIFKPADKKRARIGLGLPENAFICLFTAGMRSRKNSYKDFDTIEETIHLLETSPDRDNFFFVCVGGGRKSVETRGRRYVQYLRNATEIAPYYQAANVFIHAAKAESAGMAIQESQACGTPVIATAVGGIPEMLIPGVTGILVPPKSSVQMAEAIFNLFNDPMKCEEMGRAGPDWVKKNFALTDEVHHYLTWYESILDQQLSL
jgi:glycosyltransferase involved in cell wall biosynthesis